ncbi:MAG: hypothetical protein GTN74_08740 [Proteobacteria bacterium]|nr:hypothetical protein [Pseudomonadota bacterium]NIS70007.1 hypothetical protein [Pseudomonadota bacterium]
MGISDHPVRIDLKDPVRLSPDLPRIEDGMITCITCHEPHRSLDEYLLRKNWKRELCLSSHNPKNR